jgi:hypothetical protein
MPAQQARFLAAKTAQVHEGVSSKRTLCRHGLGPIEIGRDSITFD